MKLSEKIKEFEEKLEEDLYEFQMDIGREQGVSISLVEVKALRESKFRVHIHIRI